MKQLSLFPARTVCIAVFALTSGTTVVAQSLPSYRVTNTVLLGAPDSWDYVVFNPQSHRVFVAHGDRVTVVDGHDGAILGQVEGFPGGTHGIAISSASGRGYTDDGDAGMAASFDLTTLKIRKVIKADSDADAIAYEPASGHVFVVSGDPGTVTVIDAKTDRTIAKVEAGGKLEYPVAGVNKVYVNGMEKQEIVRIDTKTNRVDARWPIAMCTRPHGLAIDPATHRLFSSCVNNILVVVDADTGTIVATLPIGKGSDAVVFDPKRRLILSSNGRDGTLSVIQEKDAQTFVSLGSIKTTITARTMDIDPETGRIYLAAAAADPKGVAPDGRLRALPGSLKLLFLDPMP